MTQQDKNIRIRAVLDSSGFDQQVKGLQQKLQNLQRESGPQDKMSPLAKAAFGDYSSSTQLEMKNMHRAVNQQMLEEHRKLREKKRLLSEILDVEGKISRTQREQAVEVRKDMDTQRAKIDQLKSARQQLTAGTGQGTPQPSGAAQMFRGMLGAVSGAAIVRGGLNTGSYLVERDRQLLGRQAQGSQTVGQELGQSFQGQGDQQFFYAEERRKAFEMAMKETRGRRGLDVASALATVGGSALGGAAMGGMGGPLGAIGGAIGGATLGALNIGDRSKAALFDPNMYQAIATQEGMDRFQQNLRSQQILDAPKRLAMEQQNKRGRGRLQLQRIAGLSDEDLLGADGETLSPAMKRAMDAFQVDQSIMETIDPGGRTNRTLLQDVSSREQGLLTGDREDYVTGGVRKGLLRTGMDAGFQEDTITQQMKGLAGAGAQTQDISGSAILAAQAQRGLGVNAAQTLGQISGAGVTQTDDAYKRLLAEGVAMGMDLTKMPQEIQKFTSMAAQVATVSGGISEGALNTLSAGVAGFSQREMQAAGSAFQQYTGRARASGGLEGQLGFSFLMGDKTKQLTGRDLSSAEMNMLNQLSTAELSEEELERYAKVFTGGDTEKFQELINQKDMYKQTRTKNQTEALSQFGQQLQEAGPMNREQFGEFVKGEGAESFTRAQALMTQMEGGFGQLSPEQQRARILQLSRKQVGGGQNIDDLMGQVESDLARDTGRLGDTQEAGRAAGEREGITNLNQYIDEIAQSARRYRENADIYNEVFSRFVDIARENGSAMEAFGEGLDRVLESMGDAAPARTGSR